MSFHNKCANLLESYGVDFESNKPPGVTVTILVLTHHVGKLLLHAIIDRWRNSQTWLRTLPLIMCTIFHHNVFKIHRIILCYVENRMQWNSIHVCAQSKYRKYFAVLNHAWNIKGIYIRNMNSKESMILCVDAHYVMLISQPSSILISMLPCDVLNIKAVALSNPCRYSIKDTSVSFCLH